MKFQFEFELFHTYTQIIEVSSKLYECNFYIDVKNNPTYPKISRVSHGHSNLLRKPECKTD